MNDTSVTPTTFDLTRVFWRVVRRSLWVVLIACVAAAAAWGAGRKKQPVYISTALVLISPPRVHASVFDSFVVIRRDLPAVKTMLKLAEDESVLAKTMADPALQPYANANGVFSHPKGSFLTTMVGQEYVKLVVRSNDAELSTTLANVWARVFVEQVRHAAVGQFDPLAWLAVQTEQARARWARLHQQAAEVSGDSFEQAQHAADAEVAKNIYMSLSQMTEQHKVTQEIADDEIKIVQPAAPSDVVSRPPALTYAAITGLIVMAAGVFVVLVIELSRLDR